MAPALLDADRDTVRTQRVRDLRAAGAAAAALSVAGHVLDLGTLCPLRLTTGLPCPLCGLTTGVGAAAEGRLVDAVQAHPLALPALALLVVVWTPLGPAVAARLARWTPLIVVLLAGSWVARLAGLVGP